MSFASVVYPTIFHSPVFCCSLSIAVILKIPYKIDAATIFRCKKPLHQENLHTRIFILTAVAWLTSSRLTSSRPYVVCPQTLYKPSMKIHTYDAEDIFTFKSSRSAIFLKFGSKRLWRICGTWAWGSAEDHDCCKTDWQVWTVWSGHQGVLGLWYEGAASVRSLMRRIS